MTKTLDTLNGKQECINLAYGFRGFSPQSLAPIDSGPVVGQSIMVEETHTREVLHSIAEKKQRERGWGGGPIITSGNMAFSPASSTSSSKAYLPTLPQPFKTVQTSWGPKYSKGETGKAAQRVKCLLYAMRNWIQ